jgi:hypothetical protein
MNIDVAQNIYSAKRVKWSMAIFQNTVATIFHEPHFAVRRLL